jgi:hypothetical protein
MPISAEPIRIRELRTGARQKAAFGTPVGVIAGVRGGGSLVAQFEQIIDVGQGIKASLDFEPR